MKTLSKNNYFKQKVNFLPKVVDRFKLYAIYSYCSTLDGLNLIFKIVNNNRREHFMLRTICILLFKTTFLHKK